LTNLPVTAMPSHLHFDHVGGLRFFGQVALPDVAGLRARTSDGHLQLGRFEFLGLIEGMKPPALSVTQWLKPGSEIDLGNRTLKVLAAPGHTDNSTVLLDEQTGNLFTGDTIYPGHVWDYLPGTDLRALRKTVISMRAQTRAGAHLFGGHGCNDQGPGLRIPQLDAGAWQSLQGAVDRALKPSFTFVVPRTIASDPPITLDAKAEWMAK
jgi:glyoxylase-like metal-dependent hydrolase (beta-lactamase superfamily II)